MTRIHMLSGSKEYRSEETLIKLAEHLGQGPIAQSSLSCGREKGTILPGLSENATHHRDDVYSECYNAMPFHKAPTAQAFRARGVLLSRGHVWV